MNEQEKYVNHQLAELYLQVGGFCCYIEQQIDSIAELVAHLLALNLIDKEWMLDTRAEFFLDIKDKYDLSSDQEYELLDQFDIIAFKGDYK